MTLLKRCILVLSLAALLFGALGAVAQDEEMVFGDLPRSETFIVASQAPHNDVWDSFNYYQAPTYNNATGYANVIVEPAFITSHDFHAWLAQGWEYNEDGTEMTLTITEGANWNDGMPLTMDDWLFTLQYNQENADKGIAWSSFLRDVTWSAEGSEITFTLPEPNWRFHYNFTGIGTFTPVPRHIWEGEDPTTFKNPNAVHSGPYRLVSSNADTRTTIWERRDDYWDPDRMPAPKYMVWLKRPEADVAVFEWEEGNFDLGRMPFSTMIRIISANPHVKTLVHQDPCPRGLIFNTTVAPLDDKLFRRALGLLVNRQAVANLANVPGYVTPVLWPNLGDPDERYYDAAAAEEYQVTAFDPEAAAALLDEAGYPLVDGARVDKDGEPISLDALYIDIGNPAWTVWAWLLAEQAQLVGLEVNPRLLDIPTFLTQLPNGEFDIIFRWFCGNLPGDPIALFDGLHSEHAVDIGERSGGVPGRYSNPEMDALIEQIRIANPASEEAQELFRQAYRIWAEDVPYVTLFGENEGVVFNTEYWTGLAVGQAWVHWTPAARQIIDFIEPAGDM